MDYPKAVMTLYSVLALTGFCGNIWVMTTVLSQLVGCCMSPSFRARRRSPIVGVQSSACLYLLLLSIVDMMSLVPVPFLVSDLTFHKFIYPSWTCKLIYSFEAANKSLSPLVLTALSVDRYIAVCRPTMVWMRQTKFAIGIILFCCALSLCFILPVTFFTNIVNYPLITRGKNITKCMVEVPMSFALILPFFSYLLPLIFICLVYVAILRRLYKHTHLSSVGRRTSISLSRVVKCSVLVVTFYFFCWTPYWIQQITIIIIFPATNMTLADQNAGYVHEMFMYLVHALPYTQSAFNWLFYAFLNHNLRHSSRCSLGTRSTVTNTVDNAHTTSATGSAAPLWKNIQSVGSYLKNASIDTGNTLLRHSPFRSRSRIRSRSTTCLGSNEGGENNAPVINGAFSITEGASSFFASLINLRASASSKNDRPVSSNSNYTLEANKFIPRPSPDFPLLGFSSLRATSPLSMTGISLQVPSNSPCMLDSSQETLRSPNSAASAPAIIDPSEERKCNMAENSDKKVEWL